MIDIHTHIIYDVDDGSDTLEESVAIIKEAIINGVTDIIFTPHYIDSAEYNKEKVYENYNALKNEVKRQDLPIKLHMGNEVAVYGNICQILENKEVATLANSKYILIEFPMSTDVNYVLDTIFEIRVKGLIPVIAHPERCECFKKNIDIIKQAVEEGALIQCNTESIMGKYGSTSKKIVKKLLTEHLIHFFATDIHSIKSARYNNIHKVEEIVKKQVGLYEKNRLFKHNARNILLNEQIN